MPANKSTPEKKKKTTASTRGGNPRPSPRKKTVTGAAPQSRAKKTVTKAAPKSRSQKTSAAKKPAAANPKVSASASDGGARIVQAAKKVLDDIAANKKIARTSKATQEMTRQLYDKAEDLMKEAASASSHSVTKARKATRNAAHNFVKSAIGFLESIEGKIEEKPAPKKTAAKRTKAKGTTKPSPKRATPRAK